MGYIVKTVDPNSIAEEVGIMPGDEIVDFNNQPFVDIIDFYFFVSKQRFSIGYINEKGETVKVKIQKLPEENLGITFKEDILGRSRHCGNRCIFCFVDQLPKGMRKSLYHKDEDWRYSLIFGNYVTLSFLSRTDLKRIKRRKISNLYVSVHTVDEQLRRQMLGREKIRPIKPLLRKLARFGVNMHAQIVLVPGVNDGDYLKESYRFLKSLYPKVQSVSVIPLGLTAHREGLVELSEVTEEKAALLIDRISQWQEECRKAFGTGFVYASDEMFIKAKRAMPKSDYYDGYPQIENGVGLVTKFDDEFWMTMDKTKQAEPRFAKCSIISGEASYRYVKEYAQAINQRFGTDIKVICAKNNFFGGGVNVTALLTGSDVLAATEGKDLGEALFITAYAFREGENVMLDDITITDLEQRLNCQVVVAPTDGEAYVNAFVKMRSGDNI